MKLFANYWTCLCLFGLLIGLPGVEPVQVIVHPETSVSADSATLADVAELRGDASVIAILAGLPIVQLPDLSSKSIDSLVITKAIGRSLGDRFLVQGSGTVRRQTMTIDKDTLTKAAESVMLKGEDDIELSVLRHSGAVVIPAGGGEQSFVVDALDKQLSGDIPVRVRVVRGERELARALITLHVVRHRTVVVAARALHRGEMLGPSELKFQRMVLTARITTSFTEMSSVIGQEMRLEIEEGSPLQPNMVILPPAVRAGQTIELQISSPHFHVSGAAVAMGSGAVGEVINVRRLADGHTVRSRIEGPGVVTFER
jgi:flagella basal body P-ring formation protein FlgA